MSSINNNPGAAIALQMLSKNRIEKEDVQDDVSTGKAVNTAKDNAALWAISEVMENDIGGFEAASRTLSIGEATVAVASAGAEQITNVLEDMKVLAIQAQSGVADFGMIEEQMAAKSEQINSIVGSAQFNGVNLLATDTDGNGGTGLTVPTALNRQGGGPATLSTMTAETVNFEGDAAFNLSGRTAITDAASARTALDEINGFLDFAINGAAKLGSDAAQMQEQNEFLHKLNDTTKQGLGEIRDAKLDESASRLVALDAQQQLGLSGLNIANANPAVLGKLFG